MTSGALFVGSLFAFLVLLSGGYLIRHFSRKVVFTASMIGVALSTFLLIADTAPTFILGAAVRVACAGLNILCMSLYVFDFIPKSKYGDAESKRVFWGALAWILGPIIGAFLYTEVDKSLPYWLTNIAVIVQLVLFWHLRINDLIALTPRTLVAVLRRPSAASSRSPRAFLVGQNCARLM